METQTVIPPLSEYKCLRFGAGMRVVPRKVGLSSLILGRKGFFVAIRRFLWNGNRIFAPTVEAVRRWSPNRQDTLPFIPGREYSLLGNLCCI